MELERVVIGMDFSAPSLAAARWTVRHFAPEAEIILLHSLELAQAPEFLRATLPPPTELEETARQGAEQRLREVGLSLGAERIWPEVRTGRPADQIANVAREFGADLIVVGEHGRSGGLWGVLGSTAEYLARSAPVPVLLAQRLPDGPPRRILLPIEESALMETALGWGSFLTDRFRAEAIGFYVVSETLLGRMRIISSAQRTEELEDRILQDAARWLQEHLDRAGFSSENAVARVAIGDPAKEIVAAAQRMDSDLIILPTRGAGGVGEALIGSVARSVLRTSPCPILIVNKQAS
jgi:nucleotide-binding universal stress UspA family protein